MELKNISNEALVNQLKNLVAHERNILTNILWHLSEVEKRRIHLEEGYPSLFAYATQVLGYSAAQAYRRISAMRLLREVPEIESSIEAGKLNLTHLTLAQEHFKSEMRNRNSVALNEKRELLSTLENKTTREAEKIVHGLSPSIAFKERERVITDELTEIRFIASEALLQKLNRFKEIDSHVQVNPTYAELFERLVDLVLKQKDPELNQKNSRFSAPKIQDEPSGSFEVSSQNPRLIPAALKRAVYARDHGVCTYQNSKTGQKCGSKYQLQFDHAIPIAKGGRSTASNIRLRCRQHNMLEAIHVFGEAKMSEFLSD